MRIRSACSVRSTQNPSAFALLCLALCWSNMHLKKYFIFASTFAIFALGLALYAYANPGVVACAITDSDQKYPSIFEQLLSESRIRIQNTFGTPEATPILVFLDDSNSFWSLKLNEYGSTHFIGSKVCVMVGTKGRNIDVVAHELMHAEIVYRVGYWNRLTKLPVWFDEGLAMQVDFRPRYNLRNGTDARSANVKKLWSARKFFVPDADLLTNNYASAKAEVALWVADVGHKSIYSQLERLRDGETFDMVLSSKPERH
jgi:hypothetical protein